MILKIRRKWMKISNGSSLIWILKKVPYKRKQRILNKNWETKSSRLKIYSKTKMTTKHRYWACAKSFKISMMTGRIRGKNCFIKLISSESNKYSWKMKEIEKKLPLNKLPNNINKKLSLSQIQLDLPMEKYLNIKDSLQNWRKEKNSQWILSWMKHLNSKNSLNPKSLRMCMDHK